MSPRVNRPRYRENRRDRTLFFKTPRVLSCIYDAGRHLIPVQRLEHEYIRELLDCNCKSIEHQFIKLRELTQLSQKEYKQRYMFTQLLLECLERHHGMYYEGILFGSTVNGLGFKDSDVDLRLRALVPTGNDMYEPVLLDDEMVERTLRNIAHQTYNCCPAKGEFVPSVRCPVAKMKFFVERASPSRNFPNAHPMSFLEGLNYDISLSAKNSLGSFNSAFLKFLCQLRPQFHLLAIALRYWSKCQRLIQPGDLSSYALINMLIFFCQVTQPPILPTVDQMRQIYLANYGDSRHNPKEAITQIEWHCMMCLEPDLFPQCENRQPLSLLLLKFFEFYLQFPFSTHIITIRPGKALTHEEFAASTQFHPKFPLKQYVNIQDPFDLKHNLTSGLEGRHFRLLMVTIRYSYEKFFKEITNNFFKPKSLYLNGNSDGESQNDDSEILPTEKVNMRYRPSDWGLNAIFKKISDAEIKVA